MDDPRRNFRRKCRIKRFHRLAAVILSCCFCLCLCIPSFAWDPPEFLDSAFHSDYANWYGNAAIDMSAVSEGYVAVSAYSDCRLKFQVLKDDQTYTYDIASDGTPSVLPLQCGSGEYLFRIMENVSGTKYAIMCSETRYVELNNEFQPFLRPSDYANYNQDSACVAKAYELAANASSGLDAVSQIYAYICDNVVYDYIKAIIVESGYLPDPDETLATGIGICFDYASLAASMLRSLGIPTKVVFGYVAPDDVYHAWNMFYTAETGWVTVEFHVSEYSWNRMDLTFAANGSDSSFIGDGTNYSDVYYY